MFVALKNWREWLKHHSGDAGHRLLAAAGRVHDGDAHATVELLRRFRAVALAPELPDARLPSLGELGPQFVGAEALSIEQNLSIMASVEQGASRQTRRR